MKTGPARIVCFRRRVTVFLPCSHAPLCWLFTGINRCAVFRGSKGIRLFESGLCLLCTRALRERRASFALACFSRFRAYICLAFVFYFYDLPPPPITLCCWLFLLTFICICSCLLHNLLVHFVLAASSRASSACCGASFFSVDLPRSLFSPFLPLFLVRESGEEVICLSTRIIHAYRVAAACCCCRCSPFLLLLSPCHCY